MASYKVIQEVEAEDKIIGPFALKHIIYGMIAAGIGVAGWFIGSRTSYWLAVPLAPVGLVTAFVCLSALLRLNQPGDVWLFSKLNFIFRPKKRLWRQIGGTYRPFTITHQAAAPKTRPEARTTAEVTTTARDLGSLLDSRGRSIKSGTTAEPAPAGALDREHDRRQTNLHRKYGRLLSEHRNRRKKNADYQLKQTLRAQSYGRAGAGQAGKAFKTPPSGHLSAKISEMAESGDLRIATLEKMVKNLKAKERLKKNKP